jgi:small-conductance mechanosensitive channel/CRP-like cAMP-binding protein
MPEPRHPADWILRFASSGALGVGVALAILVALLVLLPAQRRKDLKLPAALLALDVVALLLRALVDPESSAARTLSTISLILLLTVLARTWFLLVVDWLLGVRLGRPLPRIIREIVQGLVYVLVVIITLRAVGVEPGSLLTTSALLTAVIGLSLQDTLGNMVAGLSIQVQRPFEVDDWIQIDNDPRFIGRVIEINWRATKVVTLESIELIIPNNTLAKTPIRNYTKPTPVARRTIEVLGPYDVSPLRMQAALLRAAWSVPGVLEEPAPFVLIPRFADSSIAYQLCYFIDDFGRRDRVDTVVRTRIWYSLERERIAFAVPTQTLQLAPGPQERERDERRQCGRRLEALRGVDFLATVPPPLLERLAERSLTCHFAPGEIVLRQGDVGHELFILQEGEVSVVVGRPGGSTAEVARLGPGKFIGEMSLMTGEPRSATVQAVHNCEMVKVDKEAFQEVLGAAPALAEEITRVLVERHIQLEENLSVRSARSPVDTQARNNALLGRIRRFFAL